MSQPAIDSATSESSQRAFLRVTGSILLLTGLAHFLLSLFGLVISFNEPALKETLARGQIPFLVIGDSYIFQTRGFVALYLYFQVMTGWIAGLLTLWAGWLAFKQTGRRFILTLVWINLIYFPLGTLAAAFLLMGRNPARFKTHFSERR